MNKTKTKISIKKWIRRIGIFIGSILLFIGITFLLLNWYIQTHEEELLQKVKTAINENQYGEIQFDSIHFSSYKHFPHISAEIINFQITDSLYSKHQLKTIFFKNVRASVSVIDLLQQKITLHKVILENGYVTIFVDETGYKNAYVFKNKPPNSNKKSSIKLTNTYTTIQLKNIDFTFKEKIKNKRITATINEIEFDFNPRVEKIIPEAFVDIQMKEMGLNLTNGTFFNDVHCIGTGKPEIDTKNKTITIPNFVLHIDDQKLINSVFINYEKDEFRFDIDIPEANFLQTVHLLSQNIQKRLVPFQFKNTLHATGIIEGKFKYRDIPIVHVKYETKNNEVYYPKENITLKNATIKGTFKNRLYEDDRKFKEGPKNFVLHFDTFSSIYKNVGLSLNNTTAFGDEVHKLNLDGTINVEGKSKYLSKAINSKAFNFKEGNFKIRAKTKGEIKNVSDLFLKSKGKIELINTKIALIKNNTTFQIPKLELDLQKEKTIINKLDVVLDNGETIRCTGTIENFNSLFIPQLKKTIKTHLQIDAKEVHFNSILATFSPKKTTKKEQNISAIKNSLLVLVEKFNPTISLKANLFNFSTITLKNLNTTISYSNKKLQVNPFQALVNNEAITANLSLGLTSEKNTEGEELTAFEYTIKTQGKIDDLNTLLKNKNFYFSEANFSLSSSYSGKARNFEDIATHSTTRFTTTKGNVYYKAINKNFPFQKLDATLKNKDIYLNEFDFILPSKKIFKLNGSVLNFTEMLSKEETKSCKATLNFSTSNFNFNNFIKWLEETKTNTKPSTKKENNLKIVLKDIYQKYHPKISLQLGEVIYNNVTLDQFSTKLVYQSPTEISLQDFEFLFHSKKGKINATVALDNPKKTPVKAALEVTDFNLSKVLATFSNFKLETLNKPTEIQGNLKATATISAIFDDATGIENNSINANLDLELNNLRVKNFTPLIDAANLVFRKSRFEDIKFATIKTNIAIKDNVLTLPRTNLQSSAIDLFAEGYIGDKNTNIWLSIPWKNFKHRDYDKIPEFKNYEEAGNKLYIEITNDTKTKKLKNKIHLSNRKLKKIKEENKNSIH